MNKHASSSKINILLLKTQRDKALKTFFSNACRAGRQLHGHRRHPVRCVAINPGNGRSLDLDFHTVHGHGDNARSKSVMFPGAANAGRTRTSVVAGASMRRSSPPRSRGSLQSVSQQAATTTSPLHGRALRTTEQQYIEPEDPKGYASSGIQLGILASKPARKTRR